MTSLYYIMKEIQNTGISNVVVLVMRHVDWVLDSLNVSVETVTKMTSDGVWAKSEGIISD